jgi:phenylacetate-CoA ligase
MLIGAECVNQNGLHTNIDHLVLEIVDEQGSAASRGDVVITDLFNYGFPLIRYQNGDQATRSHEPCSCGNPLPLIKSVDGRKLDLVETADGRKIPGEFFPHLLKDYSAVSEFQVVQRALTGVEINVVVGSNDVAQQFDDIRAKIIEVAGVDFEVAINMVDEIPLTVSGKRRVVVNLLGKDAQ